MKFVVIACAAVYLLCGSQVSSECSRRPHGFGGFGSGMGRGGMMNLARSHTWSPGFGTGG